MNETENKIAAFLAKKLDEGNGQWRVSQREIAEGSGILHKNWESVKYVVDRVVAHYGIEKTFHGKKGTHYIATPASQVLMQRELGTSVPQKFSTTVYITCSCGKATAYSVTFETL
jgi:hypothetical protein